MMLELTYVVQYQEFVLLKLNFTFHFGRVGLTRLPASEGEVQRRYAVGLLPDATKRWPAEVLVWRTVVTCPDVHNFLGEDAKHAGEEFSAFGVCFRQFEDCDKLLGREIHTLRKNLLIHCPIPTH